MLLSTWLVLTEFTVNAPLPLITSDPNIALALALHAPPSSEDRKQHIIFFMGILSSGGIVRAPLLPRTLFHKLKYCPVLTSNLYECPCSSGSRCTTRNPSILHSWRSACTLPPQSRQAATSLHPCLATQYRYVVKRPSWKTLNQNCCIYIQSRVLSPAPLGGSLADF